MKNCNYSIRRILASRLTCLKENQQFGLHVLPAGSVLILVSITMTFSLGALFAIVVSFA